MQVREAE